MAGFRGHWLVLRTTVAGFCDPRLYPSHHRLRLSRRRWL